jgi:structural maintenance of chromosome 4
MDIESQSSQGDLPAKTQHHARDAQRLIIKNIRLQNFKSYYGTHEIGPFHTNFSSIIGPNGSGKSNLIDSLVFVFGKRASWMRLKNLRELIHNSAKFGACEKAEVSVDFVEIKEVTGHHHFSIEQGANFPNNPESRSPFRNGDEQAGPAPEESVPKYVEVEGSLFTVSRSINKNDTSEYKLNGQKTTQLEIINLLKKKGIDLDNNRFMILQGEVEQISLMKPKTGNPDSPGFLEYLEEIIGTNVLIDKINELEESLDKLRSEKMEMAENFKAAEDEILQLNDTKNEALEYLRQEKSIFQLKNLQFQCILRGEEEKLKEVANKLLEFEGDEKKETTALQEKVSQHKYIFDEMTTFKREKDRLMDQKQKLITKYGEIEVKFEELRSKLENLIKDETQKTKRIEKLEDKITKVIEDKAELLADIPKLEESIKRLEGERNEFERRVDALTTKLKEKLDVYRIKLNDLKGNLVDQEQERGELVRVNSKFESTMNSLTEKLKQLKDKSQKGIQDLEEKSKKANYLERFIEKMTLTRTTIQTKIQEQTGIVEGMQKELDGYTQEQRRLKLEFEEIRQAQNITEGNSRILRELLAAQSHGKLSGIRGRLGDLVICPKELDVALSTAGLMGWDKIVVNNADQAQKALEYLRVNKIGRAGFLSLDKLEYLKEAIARHPYTGNEAQRLFDLVRVNKEDLQVAVMWAITQTLVCPNLEVAKRIAYGKQRFRVVTIDGSLIDMTGTISGGGEPRRGLVNCDGRNMDAGDRPKDTEEKIRNKLDTLAREIYKIKTELEEHKQKYDTAVVDARSIETELQRKISEIATNKTEFEISEANLQEVHKAIQKLEDEIGNQLAANPEATEYQRKIQVIDSKMIPVKEEIFKLEKQIEDLGGEELRVLKAKLREVQAAIAENIDKSNTKDARMHNFDKQIAKCQEEIEQVKVEIDACKAGQKKNQDLQDELTNEAYDNVNEQSQLNDKITEMDGKVDEAKAKIKVFDELFQKLKENIKKINERKEECQSQRRDIRDNAEKLRRRIYCMRKEYQETIANYEFLDQMSEVMEMGKELESDKGHNARHFEQTNQKNRTAREATHSKDMAEDQEDDEEDDDESSMRQAVSGRQRNGRGTTAGKTKHIGEIDWEEIFTVDVFNEYPVEILQEVYPFEKEIEERQKLEAAAKANMKPNLDSIMMFKGKFAVYRTKKERLMKIKAEADSTRQELDKYKDKRKTEFFKGFTIISAKLKETYQTLTNGGDAELELIDCLDPFSEGILFSVRPPQKSWKQMSKLSGGEKTLSSLSFVYALHYYKPNPVYFMDEIDAALDYKNVSIVARFIKEKTKNAQFIVISLRNNMYEMANKLFGIYKTMDTTKTVSIEPELIMRQIERNGRNDQDSRLQSQRINA